MSSFNRVVLMGNLTRDPELRYTQSNVAVCKIGLAMNRKVKKGEQWIEDVTFVDVTIFGKRGEAFAKFHTKGKPAFIEGSLRFDQWETNEGQKRSKLYVVADSWEFVGGDGKANGDGGGQRSAGGHSRYQRQPAGGYGQGGDEYLEVDDTPF